MSVVTNPTGAGASGVAGGWQNAYILRKFVEMLKDELLFANYSEPATIPTGTGNYVARWNIPQSALGSTTVITEASAGTVGEITNMTINVVEATVNTYGQYMKIGELARKSLVPQVFDAWAEQFSFLGASAIDLLLKAAAAKTSNFLYSRDLTTGGTGVAGDKAKATDFRAIAGFFNSKNARGFKSLGNDFVWFMNPTQETDLTTEFTTLSIAWVDVNQATETGIKQLIETHRMVGRWGGVTALRTTMIGTATQDVTAYKSFALARYGIGWAGLGEPGPDGPNIERKRSGPQDTSQPLSLYETIAWKVIMAAAMLDANRVLTVYSAVT